MNLAETIALNLRLVMSARRKNAPELAAGVGAVDVGHRVDALGQGMAVRLFCPVRM